MCRGWSKTASWRAEVSLFRRIVGLLILGVVLVFALGFAMGTRRSYRVISRSMEPALLVGDCLLMTQVREDEELRGKIIAFQANDGGPALTKRVLAQGGDRVILRDGRLWINGQKENFSQEHINAPDSEWVLKPNELFVVGDNRNNSHDSIDPDFGPIQRSVVLGVLVYRYWPRGRIGPL